MGGGSRFRLVPAAVAVAMALAGCSVERAMPPEHAGVYARIIDARQDYERGIALVLAGDEIAGENLFAAAATRMTVAIRECARTPGCDATLIAVSAEEMAERLAGAATAAPGVRPPEGAEDDGDLEIAPDPGVHDASDLGDEIPLSAEIDAVSLLRGDDLAALIPDNERVRAQINAWLTWKRPELIDAYRNYRYLRDGVLPEYEAAGLPEALLFGMMATESGAKVHAYSRAGAAGPLQFMPKTARRYGLYSIDGLDARLDPVLATRANARYVIDHLRRLRGNLELTLAAYNAGESRLRRIHRAHPEADFWDPDVYYALPFETRTYVPRVLAAARLFLRPERYGVGFPELESAVTTVRLAVDASLDELAVCLGNAPGDLGWFRTLRNLNPAIQPGERVPAGARIAFPAALVTAYGERCVTPSDWTELARLLHDADYPEKPELLRYTVRRGDSLAVIASEHRSSVRELASLNGLRSPYVIHPGQVLRVPARR